MTEVLRPSRRGDMRVAVCDQMEVDDFARARGEGPSRSPRTTRPLSPYVESSSGAPISRSSYEVEAGGDGQEQTRMNAAPVMEYPAGYRDTICMCIQTPRIPRPRNAFILYRQYHQSRVMSENPSLSNPEISRIIGERWKNEEPDIKEEWKSLAEKEKQRHASRYPNYRYQPRRNVKPQGWTASSLDEERGRCPKCKGRLTSLTPRTPADPYTSPGTSRTGSVQYPSPEQERPRPSLSRLDTCNTELPGAMNSSGSVSPLTVVNRLPLPSPLATLMTATANGDATSPEFKRRRMSSIGDYHLVGRRQDSSSLAAHSIMMGNSLPELGSLPGLDRLPMPPPPPPRPFDFWRSHGSETPSGRNSISFDESLRLPPLRTSISPGSRGMSDGRFDTSIWEPASRGPVEESHPMAISCRQKLGIMARVCRPSSMPVPVPGSVPGSVPAEGSSDATRGPFIAIEGLDANALREVSIAVEQALIRCEDLRLRVWSCGDHPDADGALDGRAPQTGQPSPALALRCLLETLERGQDISQQITQHITQGLDGTNGGGGGENTNALPVALVKDGFSMTHTDRFAQSSLEGVDGYSPPSHWTWTASLWRGVLCPDLVIYVEPSNPEEAGDERGDGAGENGACSSETIEVRTGRSGLLVVRMAKDGSLEEGVERRMVSELTRWIQEGTYRETGGED